MSPSSDWAWSEIPERKKKMENKIRKRSEIRKKDKK
jgi:hypothetical protein